MYVTAHRVKSVKGAVGINGALYLHGKDSSDTFWSPPDLRVIRSDLLGKQIVTRVEVPVGGNLVAYYLDIAGPDDATADQIAEVLALFGERLSEARQLEVIDKFAIEFSATLGHQEKISACYGELVDAVLGLCQQLEYDQPVESQPFVILVSTDADGWHFQFDEDSKARLRGHMETTPPNTLTIPVNVAEEIHKIHGRLYPHVVQLLISLAHADLMALGGVRFLHKDEVVWEWPKRGTTRQEA